MKVQIINGPNLNLIGKREKEVYGDIKMEDYLKLLSEHFPDMTLDYNHSNLEGELIDQIQQSDGLYDGIVLNAGGYTHTSVSLRDAITSVSTPVVEVHISQLLNREPFRHTSLIAPVCSGTIMGFGLDGYRLAIEALRLMVTQQAKKYK
ncbi:MAG TPA: type II 3-dehydroquinate dehydratase [Bacteroidales bacterium]|nr:type II 3-dehydroquinate dehydratase [Bacteroidales bacterium]